VQTDTRNNFFIGKRAENVYIHQTLEADIFGMTTI
jgi:hypothetical protein